ncbi:MAG: tRNA lysidine(34) synthetase TilS [Actinobacteria bacterium]|nr:tRNA lysidine(34) synthetase TilS [Actinomycetota bacterium]
MSALPDIARDTACRHAMIPHGAVVLAMVSGGADSVALLRLLASGDLGDPAALRVLHVNHGLRGEESDRDASFVAATCDELGVECRVVACDIAGHAFGAGLNLEDAGRRIRYALAESELDATCASVSEGRERGRIAVAHTFDDRLETFLARLLTGAGGGGLRSIPPVRGRIVRPLIEARRADVVGYLRSLGQEWREDATNEDTAMQRAWIRHDLLPLIEGRYPTFGEAVSRALDLLTDDDLLLTEMAEAFAHDFSRLEDGSLVFDRALMATLSPAMARRTVRAALVAAFPEALRLEFEHADAVSRGIALDGFARDLPFGLRAETEYGRLRVSRRAAEESCVSPGLLQLPGFLDLGAAGSIEAIEAEPVSVHAGGDQETIDAETVGWPLVVDSVRDGDRIRPFGAKGTKKVGDLLTDAKVPRRTRGVTPVVRDGERVVWVAGVRLADDVRVTPETQRAARLVWHRPSTDTGAPDAMDDEPREGR